MNASECSSASFLVSAIQMSCNATLGLCLQALWQLVQDIRRFVHPAAFVHASSATPHRSPSRSRAPRRRRRAGPYCQTRRLRSSRKLLPGLRALADAVGKPNEFLLAFGGGADDHEQALRVILEPGLDVDAIGPRRRHTAWRTDRDHASGRVSSTQASFRRPMVDADSPPASLRARQPMPPRSPRWRWPFR